VVEYQPDRLIAWESGGYWRGVPIVGGQRWRFRLTSRGGVTLVEHAYVWGHPGPPMLTVWLPGYPRRMRPHMERTLANLADMVGERPPTRTG